MCARSYYSYTHLILAMGIVRERIVWGFMTSTYSAHNVMTLVGLPSNIIIIACLYKTSDSNKRRVRVLQTTMFETCGYYGDLLTQLADQPRPCHTHSRQLGSLLFLEEG